MTTSTEDIYSGEYISRDVLYNSEGDINGDIKTVVDNNYTNDNTNVSTDNGNGNTTSNETDEEFKNILEGFNNSANYLTKQNRKDILIILLTICLAIIFIIFLYKLTV